MTTLRTKPLMMVINRKELKCILLPFLENLLALTNQVSHAHLTTKMLPTKRIYVAKCSKREGEMSVSDV